MADEPKISNPWMDEEFNSCALKSKKGLSLEELAERAEEEVPVVYASTYLDLEDTFDDTYEGKKGFIPYVNESETGLLLKEGWQFPPGGDLYEPLFCRPYHKLQWGWKPIESVFVGYHAGYKVTTGAYNVFLGYQAGFAVTTGSYNIFIGDRAGEANTTGGSNIYIGYQCGQTDIIGEGNVLIGYQAGMVCTGGYHTFVGYHAGKSVTTSEYDTLIGSFAGWQITNAEGNVCLGIYAGGSIITETYNTVIGTSADISFGVSYGVAIGCSAIVSGSNSCVIGGAHGGTPEYILKLGLGIAAPLYKVHILSGPTDPNTSFDIACLENGFYTDDPAKPNLETSLLWRQYYYDDPTPAPVAGARIVFGTEGLWTSAVVTQDGYLAFHTILNGAVAEKVRITSGGYLCVGVTSGNELATIEGRLSLKETTAPSATANYGKFYVKASDSSPYFMDDAGVEYNLITYLASHNLFSATHGDTVVASPVLGDFIYGNATPAWTKLAGNTTTTKKFLTQTGTGSVSAIPVLDTIAAADLPAHQLDSATYHTVSGLTAGHFLKATGAATFGFAAHGLTYSDVGALAVGGTAVDSDKWDGYQFADYLDQSVKQAAGPTLDHLHLTSGQVGFPPTQVPSADANTLDDYQEGTWQPVMKFGATTQTLVMYNGTYLKIGNMVLISGSWSWEALSGSGAVSVEGLPFSNGAGITIPLFANCSAGGITTTQSLFYNLDANTTILHLADQSGDITSTNIAQYNTMGVFGFYITT